jgi:hypothetical protein
MEIAMNRENCENRGSAIDETSPETALRRSKARQAVLERWAASSLLGPVMREVIDRTLAGQKAATLKRMDAAALWRSIRRRDREPFKMGYMIDEPSPFAPMEELQAFLKSMEALPQNDLGVQEAINGVRRSIEWREAYEKQRAGRKA